MCIMWQDRDRTPLFMAVGLKRIGITYDLVDAGANIFAENKDDDKVNTFYRTVILIQQHNITYLVTLIVTIICSFL